MFSKNHSRWKAVILDLDGTLLHSDGSISEYTLEIIQKCKRRGILVVVATARFWFKAEKYLDIISPDYAILADGTQVYHNGEMIYGCEMDELQSHGIISELLQKNEENNILVCTGKKVFCSAVGIDERWNFKRFYRTIEFSYIQNRGDHKIL